MEEVNDAYIELAYYKPETLRLGMYELFLRRYLFSVKRICQFCAPREYLAKISSNQF